MVNERLANTCSVWIATPVGGGAGGGPGGGGLADEPPDDPPPQAVTHDRKIRQVSFLCISMGEVSGVDSGTGQKVRISGYEDWWLGDDGSIAESLGHYDEVDYQRQLKSR